MTEPAQHADYERLIGLLDELKAEMAYLRERTRFEVLTTLNTAEQLLTQAAYDDAHSDGPGAISEARDG